MATNYKITPATSIFTGAFVAFSATAPGDAGSTLTIDPGAFLVTSSGGDGADLRDFNSVTVKGSLGAYGAAGWGLWVGAPVSLTRVLNVTVGAEGAIFGGSRGIYTFQITNITNSGAIQANSGYAIYENFAGAADYKIVNNKTGTIDSNSFPAIFLNNTGKHTITNSGVINGGAGVAIDTNALDNVTLTNTGTIYGDLDLESSGASKVTLTSGTVSGYVKMGAQGDTVKTGSGSYYGALLGDGNDTFTGGGANDSVYDGGGSDKITLGGGNDFYYAHKSGPGVDGIDTVDGGGMDSYYAGGATGSVNINLKTGIAVVEGHTDTIKNFETVYGSGFVDTLVGSDKADTIWGNGGGDWITGGKGADSLHGGFGVIDTFIYTDTKDSGVTATTRDNLFNFEVGAGGDLINLNAIDANTTVAGDQDFIGLAAAISAFTGVAGQLIQQMGPTGLTLFGDVNGDAKADFSIALNGYFAGPITTANVIE